MTAPELGGLGDLSANLLPLPPVTDPRALTLGQLRGLIDSAAAALAAIPRLAGLAAVLAAAAPASRRAALTALYIAAGPEERPLLRTLRALCQLQHAAEAHALRLPVRAGLHLPSASPVRIAAAAARPLSAFHADQPINPS